MANCITLEQTCECCPEQYWAKKGKNIIGYIRLRYGHLTCDYLPNGKLFDNEIRVVDEYWYNDKFKGNFNTQEERDFWLDICKEKLLEAYNELKK